MWVTLLKYLEPFGMPLGVACLLVLLALLWCGRRPWLARFWLLLALALLWGLGSERGAQSLIAPLEKMFPIPAASASAEAAVVLAGTVDLARSTEDRIELYDRPERLIEGVKLVRSGRADLLVLSGGSGDPLRPDAQEVRFLARLARDLGVPADRILLQGNSRTTAEDAEFTAALLRERGITRFFLVTSAFHLPRAMGCFRELGLEPIAYPVDFRATPDLPSLYRYLPTAAGLRTATLAVHEYIGYLAYRVMGRL